MYGHNHSDRVTVGPWKDLLSLLSNVLLYTSITHHICAKWEKSCEALIDWRGDLGHGRATSKVEHCPSRRDGTVLVRRSPQVTPGTSSGNSVRFDSTTHSLHYAFTMQAPLAVKRSITLRSPCPVSPYSSECSQAQNASLVPLLTRSPPHSQLSQTPHSVTQCSVFTTTQICQPSRWRSST